MQLDSLSYISLICNGITWGSINGFDSSENSVLKLSWLQFELAKFI